MILCWARRMTLTGIYFTSTLLYIFLSHVKTVTSQRNLFGKLFRRQCSERCGLLGLAFLIREGLPGSETCKESCVWFPDLKASSLCGGCSVNAFDIQLDFSGIPSSDEGFFKEAKSR